METPNAKVEKAGVKSKIRLMIHAAATLI